MADFSRKRRFDGGQNVPSKKFRHDRDGQCSQKDSVPPPSKSSDNGMLPPLPEIDDKYRELVCTHPSLTTDTASNYDRFEFLGDAYIELFASQVIFERFPLLTAGRMSQLRESMVKNETIGQYAVLYGLDKRLKNYKRFQNESPAAWLKIKGDVFEAYVAAVVLSSANGPQVAKEWLSKLWEPKLEVVTSAPKVSVKSKEELAKKILGKGVKIFYEDEKNPVVHYGKGLETYFVGVYFTGWGWENQYLGSGKGQSKVEAGQAAAAAALENHPLIDEVIAKRAAFYEQTRPAATG